MSGQLDGVHVLVVDDEDDIRASFVAALSAEGAEVRAVADGNEAIVACQDDTPDVVVLDMMLPKRSGFLVLEKIKGYEDAPQVVMVTANEGKRHMAYAESLGVDGYLLKPNPLAQLIETVGRLADQASDEESD